MSDRSPESPNLPLSLTPMKPTPTQPSMRIPIPSTMRPTLPPPSLVERVASLEKQVELLTGQADANARVMADCLQMTEARQWMLMRAMDDMVKQQLRPAGVGHDYDGVDWEHYKKLYLDAQQEPEAPAPEAESDIPEGAVDFGGNGG